MGVFIEFNHEILRAESLDVDGPVLVMDCLDNPRYRLLLRDGAIAQGSLVTQYRPNGRSEFQYVYHRYQPNLQVLEAEEQVGSVVVGGEQLVGTGMAVKKGDQWVKWGLWQGDKFSGYFNSGVPLGSWEWDAEEVLLSGAVVTNTKQFKVSSGCESGKRMESF